MGYIVSFVGLITKDLSRRFNSVAASYTVTIDFYGNCAYHSDKMNSSWKVLTVAHTFDPYSFTVGCHYTKCQSEKVGFASSPAGTCSLCRKIEPLKAAGDLSSPGFTGVATAPPPSTQWGDQYGKY